MTMMIPRILRVAALAAAPIVSLSAGAQAATQIGAWLSVPNVPDGALMRDCATHHAIVAYAFETDTSGTDLSTSDGTFCNVNSNMNGASSSTTQWQGDDFSIQCQGNHHHRVQLLNNETVLCPGFDPNPEFSSDPYSFDWNSDLSTNPPTNVTTCTLPGPSAPRSQFSTDGGKHYSPCANRDLTATSVGRGAPVP
jgi:hypothetical protein